MFAWLRLFMIGIGLIGNTTGRMPLRKIAAFCNRLTETRAVGLRG
jgi:hypothetical protein